MRFAAAALAALLTTAAIPTAIPSAWAQTTAKPEASAEAPKPDAPKPDDVVARIGERTITRADVALAAQDMSERMQSVPPAQREARALDALIDVYVLADLAKAQGLDKDPDHVKRMEMLEARGLQSLYFRNVLDKTVSDDDVKKRYDAEVAKVPPAEEVRARHILVKTEDEAKAVVAELDGGAKFEDVAKAKSTGPSGPKGGDLGFFGKGQMVPEFEQAVFAMEPGAYTKEPVKTQFGYHVIKLEEKRQKAPPAIEQVGPQVRNAILRERYTALVAEERKKAGVEITDPKLKLSQ